MTVHRWEDIRRRKLSSRQVAEDEQWALEESLRLDLKELRELLGKSQVEIARAARMSQGDLSRAERRADRRVSTLRRIVGALGGQLEVVAVFGKRRLRLRV